MLKLHRMASRFKQPHDFVFASETGGPLGWRNVERRAMDAAHAAAVKAKRIPASRPKPVLHDCRHTFGAMLVAEGRDVHTVKTMMGHANVSTTIDVYGGDFDKARERRPERPAPELWKRVGNRSRRHRVAASCGRPLGKPKRGYLKPAETACDDFASRRSPVRSRYAPSSFVDSCSGFAAAEAYGVLREPPSGGGYFDERRISRAFFGSLITGSTAAPRMAHTRSL